MRHRASRRDGLQTLGTKSTVRSKRGSVTGPATAADEFALPMRIGLGEHGFQLVARRLARNLQFPGGDIGRRAARDDAGEFGFRRRQRECLGEDRRGWPRPGTQGIQRQERTHFLRRLMLRPLEGPNSHDHR
jgi:hypothetical protein